MVRPIHWHRDRGLEYVCTDPKCERPAMSEIPLKVNEVSLVESNRMRRSESSFLLLGACVMFSIASIINLYVVMKSIQALVSIESRIHSLELGEDWQRHRE